MRRSAPALSWRKANGLAGRLGGDEFALLLEESALPRALAVAEDLRTKLSTRPVETSKGPIALTCSFGVSEARPGDSIDALLCRADEALYQAKLGGRNRVGCSRQKSDDIDWRCPTNCSDRPICFSA